MAKPVGASSSSDLVPPRILNLFACQRLTAESQQAETRQSLRRGLTGTPEQLCSASVVHLTSWRPCTKLHESWQSYLVIIYAEMRSPEVRCALSQTEFEIEMTFGHVLIDSIGFRSSSRSLAASNFTMPAMSPTMTEGNIATWKVKEGNNQCFLIWTADAYEYTPGDSYSTGDVLLEIETDKAQMDVEAQDDGKMAKITQGDGSKSVKVGARIAILAEADDDLSTLTLPEEAQPSSSPDTSEASKPEAETAPMSGKQDAPPTSSTEKSSASRPSSSAPPPGGAKIQKQSYPLYPSIAQLLREKGLSLAEADQIPASGPKGRLLKGDVLAYLGQIHKAYSSEQSARISKLGHLDLSNVKAAPPKEAAAKPQSPSATTKPAPPEEPLNTEIAIPISLSSVIAVQKRVSDTLGFMLPLSTLLARATELANEDLPRSTATPPTATELFNDVLGLHKVDSSSSSGRRGSRGDYIPQITALPSSRSVPPKVAVTGERKAGSQEEVDIYDILTGHSTTRQPPSRSRAANVPTAGIMGGSKEGDSTNLFSVSAAKGEEKRARTFLERVKTILQVEPGRLIL